MRHGEAENNTQGVMSSKAYDQKHLTEKGKEQVKKSAVIFCKQKDRSDFCLAVYSNQGNADILAYSLGFKKENIITDDRLHELDAGVYDGKPFDEFMKAYPSEKRFKMRLENG